MWRPGSSIRRGRTRGNPRHTRPCTFRTSSPRNRAALPLLAVTPPPPLHRSIRRKCLLSAAIFRVTPALPHSQDIRGGSAPRPPPLHLDPRSSHDRLVALDFVLQLNDAVE